MKRIRKQRVLATIVAALMVAAACGDSDGAESDSDGSTANTLGSELATGAGAQSTEGQSTDGETADAEGDSEETAPPGVPNEWLEQVPVGAPSATGWPIPAGRWASDTFNPVLTLDVPAGLTLVDYGNWSLRFGLDRPGTTGQIHLTRPSTLTDSTNTSVPYPRTIDAADEYVAALDSTTIIDQGRLDSAAGEQVGWWELEIADDVAGFWCPIDDNCISLATTLGQDFMDMPSGEPFGVAMSTGDIELVALITGPTREVDELLTAAEIMLTTAIAAEAAADAPAVDERLLTSLPRNSSTMEAGTYHRFMGGNHVRVDLTEPIDQVTVAWASPEMFILSQSGTDIAVIDYTEMLVDASVSQAGLDEFETAAIPRVDQTPASFDEWSAYIEELGTLGATGSSLIGGTDVPWFEFSVEPGSGRECGPGFGSLSADAECIEFMSSWFHSSEEDANRHFVFGPQGILVVMFLALDTPVDEALAMWQPLLDGLTVSPAG